MDNKCRVRLNDVSGEFEKLAGQLRRIIEKDCRLLAEVPDLYKDTGYGDEIFSTLKSWQQFPIFQRNVLILIARNYVEHPIDGDSVTPFATNKQTDSDLPIFKGNDSPAIASVLDALVAKMRGAKMVAA